MFFAGHRYQGLTGSTKKSTLFLPSVLMQDEDLNFLGKEIFSYEGDDGLMALFLQSTEGAKLFKELGSTILSDAPSDEKSDQGGEHAVMPGDPIPLKVEEVIEPRKQCVTCS